MVDQLAPRVEQSLGARVDIASLVAFRVLFGGAMVVAVARFFAHGWIHEYTQVPTHFFSYWGFAWVRPWSGMGMHVHYALMGAAALSLMLGFYARASAASFGLLFAYAHLVDKTNYLNHYYFVVCTSALLACMPSDGAWSVRAWIRPHDACETVPAWCVWMLRFQVGVVYFFGGVAKLNADWLWHAQPLTIWLNANTEVPLIGPWLHLKSVAYAFSWAGAFYDLTIVGWLLWRKSRPFAYVAVVAFHLVTARLFQIGIFPWIMIAASPIFFDPSWPRAMLGRLGVRRAGELQLPDANEKNPERLPVGLRILMASYVVLQLLLPLRHLAYPGNMLWTEQGYRFSWNVMLMEKNGAIEMSVVDKRTGKTSVVDHSDYLTRYQTKMMSTQPDMILQYAHMIFEDHRARGIDVEVHADAWVSLNGRRPQRLVDPHVDLALEQDTLAAKSWILPFAESQPEF